MKFCNGTTRQQSFGVAWGTCLPDSLGFFAFLLLQQKGWGRNGFLSKTAPALLLFAGSRRRSGRFESVALSSAGASGIGP
jgi:hypothetical protein